MQNLILLIEDEHQQREVLQMMFESEGFDVVGTDSGEKAMEFLQFLITSKIAVQEASGLALWHKLRHRFQDVTAIDFRSR